MTDAPTIHATCAACRWQGPPRPAARSADDDLRAHQAVWHLADEAIQTASDLKIRLPASQMQRFACPVHGAITSTVCFYDQGRETDIFCSRCYRDFVRQHVPTVTRIPPEQVQ